MKFALRMILDFETSSDQSLTVHVVSRSHAMKIQITQPKTICAF